MHGGSPIVEAVRDRYELVETEITVLMGVKWLETYVVPTIDGYKRAYGSVLCLTQVRFLPRPLNPANK